MTEEHFQIPDDQRIRIASLNLCHNPTQYIERVQATVYETKLKEVDVILLQEVVFDHMDTIAQLFAKNGYTHHFMSDVIKATRTPGRDSATAIFSRYPLKDARELNLTSLPGAQKTAVAYVEFKDVLIGVLSTHFVKEAERGHIRLKQAVILNDAGKRLKNNAGKKRHFIVAGGTFNETPEGDSIRYLQGLKTSDDSNSAFWVDVADNSPLKVKHTTRHFTHLGAESAIRQGVIRPEMIPPTRDDYMFVEGWVHGSLGHPFNQTLFGTTRLTTGYNISDHFGVMSDFWVPEKE